MNATETPNGGSLDPVVRHRWSARSNHGQGPVRMTRKQAFADAKKWMDRKKRRVVKWVLIERHDIVYEAVSNIEVRHGGPGGSK